MTEFVFEQIGVIRSPYKEKFAVPRQPGLVEDGGGELLLLPPYNRAEAVRGLSDFSHLWVMFIFHQTPRRRLAADGATAAFRRQCPHGRVRHPLHLPPQPARYVPH